MTDHRELVRRLHAEVWDPLRPPAVEEFYADDFRNHHSPPHVVDRDDLRRYAVDVAVGFPDHTLTMLDEIVEGDRLVLRYTFRGTHTVVGAPDASASRGRGRTSNRTTRGSHAAPCSRARRPRSGRSSTSARRAIATSRHSPRRPARGRRRAGCRTERTASPGPPAQCAADPDGGRAPVGGHAPGLWSAPVRSS